MLGALTLLIVQAAAPAAAEMPSEEAIAKEVVAINRTLDKWQGGVYKKEDGKLTCRMEQSSGDQAVDLLRCGAMVGCYAPRVEELDAIAASDAPAADRKAKMREVMDEVQPCVEKAHREGVRRIAIVRASL
ncbi:hypothetical protein [Qipengyuania sphaerica]|uniref:hypothetical protein n=1 Tax=Qipengyuania sphaerica TaxID=2867243 RepID=UPI001C88C6AF|nr:hypothetical protein [Qipengyuania sphaerica]MBX7541572.1 hypothetical protein [Qipengyuania sphaerica]